MSLHRSPRHATHPESASGVRAGDFSELLCDRYREYFSSPLQQWHDGLYQQHEDGHVLWER
jgi:hypothetical protein